MEFSACLRGGVCGIIYRQPRKGLETINKPKDNKKMSKTLETMTPELRSFVEEWKAKPGNLIMVLHRVQQTYGYIPREIAIEIGQIGPYSS